jgi:hypothetical protein
VRDWSAIGRSALRGARYDGERARVATPNIKGTAMGLVISILITFLVIILLLYLVNLLPIKGQAKQIVRVIIIILGILSLLRYLGVGF